MINEDYIATENVDELKNIIDSCLSKEQIYLSEINILKEQIRCLQDRLFGRKTEKIISDDKQLHLFDIPEENFPIADEPEDENESEIPSYKRKKRGRKPIPANLPLLMSYMIWMRPRNYANAAA